MDLERESMFKTKDNVRMSGFLEKKGKMKLMSSWRKYWFVLEKRLLLYYKSKLEYTNLSPCRGSLNMGLVTTVRPGSSSGPCIIHIVTRTQSVQLRAKNRASQEEWLQALLHSMALPLMPKIIKSPTAKFNFLGCTTSLDNVSLNNNWKHSNLVDEWTLPRKLNYRKRQISGAYYGGSLDTAIWSKKFKSLQSSNVRNNRNLEKFLIFPKEINFEDFMMSSQRDIHNTIYNENQIKFLGKNERFDEIRELTDEAEKKCKVHDDNKNYGPSADFIYGFSNKNKKRLLKTFSDNQLAKSESIQNLNSNKKIYKKDETPFGHIKNVLSRTQREKSVKYNIDHAVAPVKRRRQSFLQKVFKLRNNITDNDLLTHEKSSDVNADHEQDQISEISVCSKNENNEEECIEFNKKTIENEQNNENLNEDKKLSVEIKKNLAGSKTILPDPTLAELKMKLKTRDSLEKQEFEFLNDENSNITDNPNNKTKAPSLPPRRVSRPVSPWHDVPSNNAPIFSEKKQFFSHQATVKFKDTGNLQNLEISECHKHGKVNYKENSNTNVTNSCEDSNKLQHSNAVEKERNEDDLSTLLEQLTKITVAPLAEPEFSDRSSSPESNKFNTKNLNFDPDYDIPRPHRPFNLTTSNENITKNELIEKLNDIKASRFLSIEPDSLEIEGK